MPYRFERDVRTPHSEVYVIENDEGEEVGRIDIHFTSSIVYATLCVTEDTDEDDVQELIDEVDERLVLTADPYREDFVVTVWTGRETGVYSEDDDEDDEDVLGDEEQDGHRG